MCLMIMMIYEATWGHQRPAKQKNTGHPDLSVGGSRGLFGGFLAEADLFLNSNQRFEGVPSLSSLARVLALAYCSISFVCDLHESLQDRRG